MSLYDIPIVKNSGEQTTLAEYKDKTIVIVNVASKCGLTPQYEGLQKLYEQYKDQGVVVLGFPANNFKGQEPGTDDEIKEFCSTKYNVSFPLFKKISVVGEDKHPLYAALIAAQPVCQQRQDFQAKLTAFGIQTNEEPELLWNFEKFILKGDKVERFSPGVPASDAAFVAAVEKFIAQ